MKQDEPNFAQKGKKQTTLTFKPRRSQWTPNLYIKTNVRKQFPAYRSINQQEK